jgi:hypothetical protein
MDLAPVEGLMENLDLDYKTLSRANTFGEFHQGAK